MGLRRVVVSEDLVGLKNYISDTFFSSTGALVFEHRGGHSGGQDLAYLQSTDLLYTIGDYSGSDSSFNGRYWLGFDPRLEDFSQTLCVQAAAAAFSGLYVGQYNVQTGEQRLYAYKNLLQQAIFELDPSSLLSITDDAYPGCAFNVDGPGPDASTAPNNWGSTSAFGQDALHRWQLMEGLTGGVTGETEDVGSNVYPSGLALVTNPQRVSLASNRDLDGAVIWVDLSNGYCVGYMRDENGNPLNGQNSGVDIPGGAPKIGGDLVPWTSVQFVPDEDTSFAQPKGELVFSTDYDTTQDFATTQAACWVRFVDFNPFGIAGGTARTHGRVTLTTHGVMTWDPVVPGGDSPPAGSRNKHRLVYVPNQRGFVHIFGIASGTEVQTGNSGYNSYRREPVAAVAGYPQPESTVQTADVVRYRARLTGDLGEPVAGAQVSWTEKRLSTIGEVLANTDPTYIANPPYDDDGASSDNAVVAIYEDSGGGPVLLAETTDYTLSDNATGEITWAGTHPNGGSTYTATYQHLRTAVSPGHGAIVRSDSTTDIDGVATCDVHYPDDDTLEGGFTQVEVTFKNSGDP